MGDNFLFFDKLLFLDLKLPLGTLCASVLKCKSGTLGKVYLVSPVKDNPFELSI